MPSKSLQMFAAWSNYNLTVGEPRAPYGTLGMTIENLYSLHCSDVDETDPLKAVAATAQVLLAYLAELEQVRAGNGPVGFPPRNFAAATVGRGWSFAPLIGTPVAQLLTAGLSWGSKLAPGSIAAGFKGDRNKLMIAGGGTRLRELVSLAERQGLSLPTGGSHLGQSLAGSFGTGTHGSRIGKGGLQNIVRAMHIVTGPGSHVWLQPGCSPVLSEAAIAQISPLTPPSENGSAEQAACLCLSDDQLFNDALIHLGGMGIVNAVVVELVDIEHFNVLAIDRPINDAWLDKISDSKFCESAEDLGISGMSPEFYELTLDPQDPFGPHAAHVVYTLRTMEKQDGAPMGTRPVPADAISNVAAVMNLGTDALATPLGMANKSAASQQAACGPLDPVVIRTLQQMLAKTGSSSVFEHYRKSGHFRPFPGPINPDTDAIANGSWGEIHGDEITGGIPGALYNASFAIDRKHTTAAINAITAAVKGLPPSFVFTLRFVDHACGTLAFTRFDASTVIEIDGLSPFAISMAKQQYLAANSKPDVHVLTAFAVLATTLERGAMAVRRALDGAGIDFSMHWAKQGNLDAAKIAADYRLGQIAAWQATRQRLLGPEGQILFSNPALEEYGLVTKP